MTFNPVWGCLNHCEYCYARKIAKRFWKKMWMIEANHQWKEHPDWAWTGDHLSGLKDFKPTFLNVQYEKKLPKKPQRIFIGSMSEIAHWEKRWMEVILGRILCYPQHTFQFLAKHPEVYSKYDFPKNCWLGVTITKNDDFDNGTYDFLRSDFNRDNIKYISLEPLLGRILSYKLLKYFDWVIIGAETGNRRGKIVPKKEWIEDFVNCCRDNYIPIYLKDSLKNIYPVEIKEFPKEGCL